MRLEGKRNSLILFLIGVYLPSMLVIYLQATSLFSEFISATFFIVSTAIVLGVLLLINSDDGIAYENFGPQVLIYSVITGLGMTVLSWGISSEVLHSPEDLMALVNPVTSIFMNDMGSSMSLVVATSVVTSLLFLFIKGLIEAATFEELWRLPIYAEGKKRWGNGLRLGRVVLPGVLVYAGFPIVFWGICHGIQAYDNLVMIIPAIVNGVLLTILLWRTRCIVACIFAHWIYNGVITLICFLNGSLSFGSAPLVPDVFGAGYFGSSGFIVDLLSVIICVWALVFFLLPSLRRSK